MKYSYKIQENEFWWGGAVSDGSVLPFTSAGEYELNFLVNRTYNQVNPLFVSSHGRYLYIDGKCIIHADGEYLTVSEAGRNVFFEEGFSSLKEAYLAAAKRFFVKEKKPVPEITYAAPQYCTWMEMLRNIDQEKILAYAEGIVKRKMPPGVLILDDGWMEGYGEWSFRKKAFPDPKAMIETLHKQGFRVILWVCPFVDRTAAEFKMLEEKGALVRTAEGKTAERVWWSGKSAVLDGTNPDSFGWLGERLDALMRDYGVDGFKLDAGDAFYYESDDITCHPTTPNGQSLLWAEFARRYEYAELRACVGMGGASVVQRLSDKRNDWSEKNGLGSLIANMIQSGLCGYMYCCPDMIGGGNESDVKGDRFVEDEELVVRSCECAAMMPMMQFSYAIWKKNSFLSEIAQKFAKLHTSLAPYLKELSIESAENFEPMLRCMEYEFPHCGLERVKEQFMLGSRYLVAPVIKKGERKKKVILPEGSWLYVPENRVYGPGVTEVDAPIDVLPYFERVRT